MYMSERFIDNSSSLGDKIGSAINKVVKFVIKHIVIIIITTIFSISLFIINFAKGLFKK